MPCLLLAALLFAAPLPDTPLGSIAREFQAAVNSGSEQPLREFVTTHMSESGLRRQSADSWIALFRKFQQQSGGFEVLEVTPATTDRPMMLLVKTLRGERYARVMLGLDDREPAKLAGMGIERADAPAAAREGLWPAGRVSEKAMIGAIRKRIDALAAANAFSGVVLVAHGNTILLHVARGMADREAAIPNTLDTTFHLASVGKMFTAAAIAQLVRAGKLRFDDTVASVFPDFPNGKKITIHHLLTHSAGMGTWFESPGFVRGKRFDTSIEEMAVYRDEPLFFEPGTGWRYSNAAYSLLGAIIEKISGQEYGAYVRKHIFVPLKMTATATPYEGLRAPAIATFYTQSDDDPLGLEPFTPDPSLQQGRRTGFGDGYSTARDLFRFLRALRTGSLLGPAMTQRMIDSKVDQDGRGTRFYGYGIQERSVNGAVVRGHTGGGRVGVEMLWDSGYTVIVLQNAIPPTASSLGSEIAGFIAKQRDAGRVRRLKGP